MELNEHQLEALRKAKKNHYLEKRLAGVQSRFNKYWQSCEEFEAKLKSLECLTAARKDHD